MVRIKIAKKNRIYFYNFIEKNIPKYIFFSDYLIDIIIYIY